MKIKIKYFASLRETADKTEETVETNAGTPAALYDELVARYGFTLEKSILKAAINEVYAEFDAQLEDGDTVVFIPPVAGG